MRILDSTSCGKRYRGLVNGRVRFARQPRKRLPCQPNFSTRHFDHRGETHGCSLYSHSRSRIPLANSLADLGLGALAKLKTAPGPSRLATRGSVLRSCPCFNYWLIGPVPSVPCERFARRSDQI